MRRNRNEGPIEDAIKAPEDISAPPQTVSVTIVNNVTGGDEDKVAAAMAKIKAADDDSIMGALMDEAVADAMQAPPMPKKYVACVCSDPYGRVVLLNHANEGAPLGFPMHEIMSGEDIEAAANACMRNYAGFTAPTWEVFAEDTGLNVTYVRAHTRAVYDAQHVCPEADGTMHLVPIESITDITASKTKHVIWVVMLAIYGPLMSELRFACPDGV